MVQQQAADKEDSWYAWSRHYWTLRQSLVISRGHGPQKVECEMKVLRGAQAAEQGDKEGLLPHSTSR